MDESECDLNEICEKFKLLKPSDIDIPVSYREYFGNKLKDTSDPDSPTSKELKNLSFDIKTWKDKPSKGERQERETYRDIVKTLELINKKIQYIDIHENALQQLFETQISDKKQLDSRTQALEQKINKNHIEDINTLSDNLSIIEAKMATNTYPSNNVFKSIVSFDGAHDSNFEKFLRTFEMFLSTKGIDKEKNPNLAFAQLSLCLTDKQKYTMIAYHQKN